MAPQNEFESVPAAAIFLNNLRKIGINYYLNVGYNSPSPFGPGLLFTGVFFFFFSLLLIQFHH